MSNAQPPPERKTAYELAVEQANRELGERMGMDVQGRKDDPIAHRIDSVLPDRVTHEIDPKTGGVVRRIIPNEKFRK